MHFAATQRVHAPRDVAWQVLTDVERMPEWTASMRRVQRLDGGELRVGSRTRIEQPGLRPATWTVTRLEPGRSFVWETRAPGVRIVASHTLETRDGALECGNAISASGWLAPLLMAFLQSRIRRYLDMELDGWKRRSEMLAAPRSG